MNRSLVIAYSLLALSFSSQAAESSRRHTNGHTNGHRAHGLASGMIFDSQQIANGFGSASLDDSVPLALNPEREFEKVVAQRGSIVYSSFDIHNPRRYTVLHAAVDDQNLPLIARIISYLRLIGETSNDVVNLPESRTAFSYASPQLIERFAEMLKEQKSDSSSIYYSAVGDSRIDDSDFQPALDDSRAIRDSIAIDDSTTDYVEALPDSDDENAATDGPVAVNNAASSAPAVEVASPAPVEIQPDRVHDQVLVEDATSDDEYVDLDEEEEPEVYSDAPAAHPAPVGLEPEAPIEAGPEAAPELVYGPERDLAHEAQVAQELRQAAAKAALDEAQKNHAKKAKQSILSKLWSYKWHAATVAGIAGVAWYYYQYIYNSHAQKPEQNRN